MAWCNTCKKPWHKCAHHAAISKGSQMDSSEHLKKCPKHHQPFCECSWMITYANGHSDWRETCDREWKKKLLLN